MRIISIANQKGGTAKTSTAHALATGAIYKGKRALAIDLDPQGNLTYIMGADANRAGSYEIMKKETGAAAVLRLPTLPGWFPPGPGSRWDGSQQGSGNGC